VFRQRVNMPTGGLINHTKLRQCPFTGFWPRRPSPAGKMGLNVVDRSNMPQEEGGREWQKRNVEAQDATMTRFLSPSAFLPFALQEVVLVQARLVRVPRNARSAVEPHLDSSRSVVVRVGSYLRSRPRVAGSSG
jgi:hypothetical protein